MDKVEFIVGVGVDAQPIVVTHYLDNDNQNETPDTDTNEE